MTMRTASLTLLVLLAAACGGHDFEPPDRSERVQAAAEAYDSSMFDSLTWESDEARELAGNTVYAETCRRCHGPLGRGETEYARERGLTVPSLVERDWDLTDPEALRRNIFVGHEDGMPIYGDAALSVADIDAVAGYILEVLRPDVNDGQGG
jgi:mono/diheme cytochrome c family protein